MHCTIDENDNSIVMSLRSDEAVDKFQLLSDVLYNRYNDNDAALKAALTIQQEPCDGAYFFRFGPEHHDVGVELVTILMKKCALKDDFAQAMALLSVIQKVKPDYTLDASYLY